MKRKLLFSFLTALFAIPAVNVSAEEFKLDLSTATYASASEEEVVWEAELSPWWLKKPVPPLKPTTIWVEV